MYNYYRIQFDATRASWIIQIRSLFIWRSIKDGTKVALWKTYEEAEKFVQERGLDKIYVQIGSKPEKNEQMLKFPVPPGYRLVLDV